MPQIQEAPRTVPVVMDADVCVVGGSCTGVFAAVRAARLGARVALVEAQGFLGGVATAGLVTIWHSAFDMSWKKQIVGGLSLELIERLKRRDAVEVLANPNLHRAYVLNPEETKIDLDEMVSEAGVRPFLHARFVAPVHENGRMSAAIIEDKSGRRAITAKFFIDASGDGDVIARMELPFTVYPELQPPTTVAIFDHYDKIRQANPEFDLSATVHDPKYPESLKQGFLWGSNVVGRPSSFMIAGSRAHHADCADADQLTTAEIECRRQIRAISDILRNHVPGGKTLTLANLAPCIGIRETRHAHCRHTLTADELLNGVAFNDTIAVGTYPADTHHSNKPGITLRYLDGTEKYSEPSKPAVLGRWRPESEGVTPYYQIPFSSLVPQGAENVLVAGRILDADKGAYGATRVMMNCNQTGEAAGVACALALRNGSNPGDIAPTELRQTLRDGGSLLP